MYIYIYIYIYIYRYIYWQRCSNIKRQLFPCMHWAISIFKISLLGQNVSTFRRLQVPSMFGKQKCEERSVFWKKKKIKTITSIFLLLPLYFSLLFEIIRPWLQRILYLSKSRIKYNSYFEDSLSYMMGPWFFARAITLEKFHGT